MIAVGGHSQVIDWMSLWLDNFLGMLGTHIGDGEVSCNVSWPGKLEFWYKARAGRKFSGTHRGTGSRTTGESRRDVAEETFIQRHVRMELCLRLVSWIPRLVPSLEKYN